ncbi:MAG: hypothetical protein L7F77_08030, partial [Candidatus Magnetominusculus sp. LBB02]|nr:hypothetical protein [Candidatus Magnetominusculus sp. LBB02]
LFELLPAPCALVFDDYHDIAEDCALHKIIVKGLSAQPDGISVVFISRAAPPPSYIHFQAQRKISHIDFNDIRFNLEESGQLIKTAAKRPIDDNTVAALLKQTNGWVVGLILGIAEINRTKDSSTVFNMAAANETMFEYFSIVIFDSLPKDAKEFLLNTAWLPEFTLEMASKAAPAQEAAKILNSTHFVTQKHRENTVIYGFHDLFRDFLIRQSEIYYGQRLEQIVLQAADILVETPGYVDQGIELALKMRSWGKFTQIILKRIQGLIDEGKHILVDSWFSTVPEDFMHSNPWLMFWQGVNKIYLSPKEARKALEPSYHIFKTNMDKVGQLLALCAVIKTFLFEWTDFHPLDYWISEFEELLTDVYRHTDNDTIKEAVVTSIAPALMFRQSSRDDLDYWIMEAEKIVINSKRVENRMSMGYILTSYYLWTGVIYKAGIIVDRLALQLRQTKSHPVLRLTCLSLEAMYFAYVALNQEAIKSVEEGLKIAGQTGVHLIDGVLLTAAVYAALMLGKDKLAEDYLKQIVSNYDNTLAYPSFYYNSASLVELSKGAFPTAIEYAQRHLATAQRSGCQLMIGMHKNTLSSILVEAGRYDDALRHLKDMEEIGIIGKSRLFICRSYVIKSLIALRTNNYKWFDEMFDNFAKEAAASGKRYVLPLQRLTEMVCKAALQRGIQTDFAKELIGLYHIKADGHAIEDWPWAIKIYTLGRFEIFRDGKPLKFSGKPQKIPLLMLKAILASGARHVDAVLLSDQLWPDEDGDAAHNLFSTNMHRLRKLLGAKEFIEQLEGYLYINHEFCWLDTWAFDDIVEKINNYQHGGDDMTNLFEKMCRLYKGDFLPGVQNEQLAIHTRQRLKRSFIDACFKAGAWFEKHDKWDDAIKCYKNSISIYNSEEALYQRLMACYQKLGRTADAAAAYRICREALQSAFGTEPSPETKELSLWITHQTTL